MRASPGEEQHTNRASPDAINSFEKRDNMQRDVAVVCRNTSVSLANVRRGRISSFRSDH